MLNNESNYEKKQSSEKSNLINIMDPSQNQSQNYKLSENDKRFESKTAKNSSKVIEFTSGKLKENLTGTDHH